VSPRVLITGAAGGIGSATVDQLRATGAEVLGLDLLPDAEGGVVACDVRSQASVDAAVAEAVERLGGLDVLINNAGIGLPQASGERPDASADAVIDVNLLGPWRVTAAALPALRASHGRVVNVASGLAYMAVPMAPAYCMAKRGLTAYSDSLRIEHGDAISVTTVYPGYIRTPIHDAAAEQGLSLDGAVPAERVSDAARTLVRASLGAPVRDLATTRRGGVGYFLLRHLPRRLIDWFIAGRSRKVIAATLGPQPSTRSSHARQAVKASEEAS
jgi:NAD(P)-dependent dehydrogenase (short-subunit alcohol dehydrogenase family)